MFGQYQLVINYKKTETMIRNYLHIRDVHKQQDEAQIEHCNAADTEKPNPQKHAKAVHEKKGIVAYTNVTNTNLTTNKSL